MTTRTFTVAEANALLPELEDALARIRQHGADLERHWEQQQILELIWGETKVRSPETPDHAEFKEHQIGVIQAGEGIDRIVQKEIVSRGVRFPAGGIQHGLLDFPTTLDGRTVYLCWRVGEPSIAAWHEVEAGYAGRQPLTTDLAIRMGR